MLITALMKNQKIEDLFTALTLSNATLARAIPPISENISGFVNLLFLKDKARPVDIDPGKLVTCMQLGVDFQLLNQYYAQVYMLLYLDQIPSSQAY